MKRLVSLALACALGLAPAAYAADSGAHHLPKLDTVETAALLADNPLTLPRELYAAAPSVSAPYAAGRVSDAALTAGVDRLNMLRRLAGLDGVQPDAQLSETAQYGAVLQAANKALNHQPARPADMDTSFYQKGYAAASSSNLASGYTLTGAMDGFMNDSDASNIDRLGHRRWQLNPALGKVGLGAASHYVAETVVDESAPACEYDFIAWPASGVFPNNTAAFSRNTAWSITLNPEAYSPPHRSEVTVTLTRQSDGARWTFGGGAQYEPTASGKYFNVDTAGYGVPNCIIFRPDGVENYEGVYTVEVRGLRDERGAAASLSYEVDFFDPATRAVEPFADVFAADYYARAILWALEREITTGTGAHRFSPAETCTTAQILTFLWRAQGAPTASVENGFADVRESDYFYQAALWAQEQGLAEGSRFGGSAACTRSMVVSYLWKLAGQPETAGAAFADVPAAASYADAVAWAVAEGITTGTDGNTFSPNASCTRGQIVTFLYRAFAA